MSAPRTSAGSGLVGAIALGVIVTVAAMPVGATPEPTLITFKAGEAIRAADFNANFGLLLDRTTDLDQRVGATWQLTTKDQTNVVAAINEVAARPSSLHGAVRMRGGVEHYSFQGAGSYLVDFRPQDGPKPHAREIAGRAFTLQLAAQLQSGTSAMAPLTPGEIVARLDWVFYHGGIGQVVVAHSERLTLSLTSKDAVTATLTGTVPEVPMFGVDITEARDAWALLVIESKTVATGPNDYLYGSAQLLIVD